MNHRVSKFTCLLLALLMVCTLLPATVFAGGGEGNAAETPAAVQAFLSAVEAISIPEEINDETGPALNEQIGAAQDAYDALSEEDLAREDVQAAAAVMQQAVDALTGGAELMDLNTGHRVAVRFVVLYVGSEFFIGYSFGDSENTTFICQYSTPHSDTAYNNHTIAESDIKAASTRLTINNGYEVKGWTKSSSSNPNVNPFRTYGAAACNKGDTIYIVAKKTAPTTYSYTVNHVYRTNGVEDGTYTQSFQAEAGTTVYASNITKRTTYNNNTYTYTRATPTSANITGNGTTFTLYYDRTAETKPDAPTSDEVTKLLNNAVKVHCTNTGASHANVTKTYGLIGESFSIGNVYGDATEGYKVDVTVSPATYVAKYNTDIASEHTPSPANQSGTITLKYKSGTWEVVSNTRPVTFTVVCETEEPVPTPPNKPGEDDVITALTDVKVKVECDANADHKKEYDVLKGSFTVGDVTGEGTDSAPYTVTVTVNAEKYVEQFNLDVTGATHEIVGDNAKNITLKFVDGSWVVDGTPDVTFTVQEEEEQTPDGPTAADLADAIVNLICRNIPDHNQTFSGKENAALFEKAVTFGEVGKDESGNYICTATMSAAPFLEEMNKTNPGHSLAEGSEGPQVLGALYYNGDTGEWNLESPVSGQAMLLQVIFHVTCSDEKPQAPTFEQIRERLSVELNCTKDSSHSVYFKETPFEVGEHGVYKGQLIKGSTTASDVEWDAALGAWVCDVTVDAKPYCKVMNEGSNLWHRFADQLSTKTVKMRYTPENHDKPWSVVPEQRMVVQNDFVYGVEFNVTCEESTSTPGAPTVDGVSLGSVTLVCDRVSAHDKQFDVLESSVQIGEVQQNAEGFYTCEVTVQAAPYLAELNKANPVHRLANGERGQASWTMYYRSGNWLTDIGTLSPGLRIRHISFHVICDAAAPVYPKEYCYIDATATGGGSISPRGTVRVPVYDDQTFYMLAEPGYALVDVLVDGVSVGAVGSYTFRSVTRHHTIHAVFQPLSALPPQTGGDSTAVLFHGMGLILTACAAFVCLHRRKEN